MAGHLRSGPWPHGWLLYVKRDDLRDHFFISRLREKLRTLEKEQGLNLSAKKRKIKTKS